MSIACCWFINTPCTTHLCVWYMNVRLFPLYVLKPFLRRDRPNLRTLQTPRRSACLWVKFPAYCPTHPKGLYSHLFASRQPKILRLHTTSNPLAHHDRGWSHWIYQNTSQDVYWAIHIITRRRWRGTIHHINAPKSAVFGGFMVSIRTRVGGQNDHIWALEECSMRRR